MLFVLTERWTQAKLDAPLHIQRVGHGGALPHRPGHRWHQTVRRRLRRRPVQWQAGWDLTYLQSWKQLKFQFILSGDAGKTKKYLFLCLLPVHQWGESPVNHYYSNPQRYSWESSTQLCPDQSNLTGLFCSSGMWHPHEAGVLSSGLWCSCSADDGCSGYAWTI